jgi:hypothetical protein
VSFVVSWLMLSLGTCIINIAYLGFGLQIRFLPDSIMEVYDMISITGIIPFNHQQSRRAMPAMIHVTLTTKFLAGNTDPKYV